MLSSRSQHLRPSLAPNMRRSVECFATDLTRHGTMCKIAFWKCATSFSTGQPIRYRQGRSWLRCIWMRGRIENVRSGKQTKSHLLTSSASGLRSQCRAHSILGTFPFVRIKPEHEASHIAATVTAKILGQKGEFSSLLASALPLLFLLLTPPAFLTVSPRN
jgi:hypothetical protein